MAQSETESAYSLLFKPLRVGAMDLPNRLFFAPHWVKHLALPDPEMPGFARPRDGLKDYYAERARGGLGLIIQGATVVHRSSVAGFFQLFDKRAIEYFRPVVDAVHAHGSRIFVQLMHGGNHHDLDGSQGGPLSPSGVADSEFLAYRAPVRAMTREDMREIAAAWADSAANAVSAGYDGVEVHASHNYLLAEFLSPFYNQRRDEYGGGVENRVRFVIEVLEAIRAAVGPVPIGVRLIADELLPGGLTVEDAAAVAGLLDDWGVDFLNVGPVGSYHDISDLMPPLIHSNAPAIEAMRRVRAAIRRAVVIGVPSRLETPEAAQKLLADGTLDVVGAARTFMADPEFALKVRSGRALKVRPCIGLNACAETGFCAVNPSHQRESVIPLHAPAASSRKRVMVVGGGPAGLEVARVAAVRGHEVTIVERDVVLGGSLNSIALLPRRDRVRAASEWWIAQLADLSVNVRMNEEATATMVLAERPDAVVVATGARWDATGATSFRSSPIDGVDRPFVFTVDQALVGAIPQGQGRLVMLDEDGGTPGAGVAEWLADRGHDVTIVTRWPHVAPRLEAVRQRTRTLAALAQRNVRLMPQTYVQSIGSGQVTVFDVYSGAVSTINDVAAVVLATQRRPRAELVDELRGAVAELHVIGDAAAPRQVVDAVAHANRVALEI